MARSAAIRLLEFVWGNEGKAQGSHSWDRLNGAMQQALHLAVESGFVFALNDFSSIVDRFDGTRWLGVTSANSMGERYYSMACAVERGHGGNLSAARSFEKWKGRKPFLYATLDCLLPGSRRGSMPKQTHKIRLAEGAKISWIPDLKKPSAPCHLTVTSFNDDKGAIVAVQHEWVPVTAGEPSHGTRHVVKRRFTITYDALAAHNDLVATTLKERRAAKPKEE